MTTHIVPFDETLAPQVTEAYNHAVARVPHCYPVSPEEFSAAVASTEGPHGRGTIRDQVTLVAQSSGRVLGFATAAPCTGEWGREGPEEKGVIRMLWYERGQRPAGQALLEAAEAHLHGHGMREILAFEQYAFRFPTYHFSCAQLTDRWEHVHALLGANGYQRSCCEVFLDWMDFRPPDPGACPVEADLRVERWPGQGSRANLAVHAERGGERLGICASRCCGEYSSDARAQDWLLTNWLWIDEGLQGQGLGRYLLLRALTEARADGFLHAAISADRANHRAILFYGNIGYHAVDWTTEYSKGAQNGSS